MEDYGLDSIFIYSFFFFMKKKLDSCRKQYLVFGIAERQWAVLLSEARSKTKKNGTFLTYPIDSVSTLIGILYDGDAPKRQIFAGRLSMTYKVV